ncbi:MAG: geranylgeranyl reductase family protein [Acidimicrobiales bacterium]
MSPEPTHPAARHTVDVVVVGAGPAGATAATLLARAGRRVLLVDKAVFPRDKCCGDGLTTLALRELDLLGLDPSWVPNWQDVDAAWLRSPSGREVCVPLPPADQGRFAATTPRRELDAALVRLAVEAGADLREGWAIEAIDQRGDHVDAVFRSGDGHQHVQARYVVAADGMWSPTRKLLGLAEPGYLGEWHAFRQYARHVTGPARERLYVWFEADLLPGYAWSFPLPDGRVNIGFGILRDGERKVQDMKALWVDLLQRPHVREALGPDVELEDRHTAWPIPAGIDRATLTADRTLFVGDAARATDTMTGEGIGQAVLTGRLAAEAIVAAGALEPHVARAHYEHAVRHHLLADHRMSHVLSKALAHERGARGAIRLVGTSAWTRRNFARWMFEDEPRAVLLTPSRWHRALLRRRGAYHP